MLYAMVAVQQGQDAPFAVGALHAPQGTHHDTLVSVWVNALLEAQPKESAWHRRMFADPRTTVLAYAVNPVRLSRAQRDNWETRYSR
jgi:hypothetical protein